MSWANHAKQELQAGRQVQIRPRGNSMRPRINSGDLVTLDPVSDPEDLKKMDAVLVRVKGKDYVHLIKAIRPGPRFQIGNNKGGINGWVGPDAIFGKVVAVEP